MAKLSKQIQTFVVQRLACFDTPSEVAAAVSEEFGVEVQRMQVHRYDPTKAAGHQLSRDLTELFHKTRDRFIDDTSEIAVSHKAVRLRMLEKMIRKADSLKNYALAAQLLEQAAKECGGLYTNFRKVAPTDPSGDKPWEAVSEEHIDARIEELAAKYGYEAAN